jgi:transposase
LLPPSLNEWLPERHLARFVVEVVNGLDLSAMVTSYRGTGSAGYHPALLLGLLVYRCATGVLSSRKLERATYDSVAFRFIAANDHPDHDTIATFRRRFLKDIEGLFVRVLELAREMGMLKLGTAALDSALSYERAGKIEARLKAEVADLMARAEAADQADIADGMSIPEELARRKERLAKLAAALAKERFEQEMAEHRAKQAAREAKVGDGQEAGRQATGSTGRRSAAQGPDRSDRQRFAAGAGEPDTGRNHGLASADTARARSATVGASRLRHHQVGDGIPPVSVARVRLRSRRVEPCCHGLEHQEDVCAQPRLSALQRLRSNNGRT